MTAGAPRPCRCEAEGPAASPPQHRDEADHASRPFGDLGLAKPGSRLVLIGSQGSTTPELEAQPPYGILWMHRLARLPKVRATGLYLSLK